MEKKFCIGIIVLLSLSIITEKSKLIFPEKILAVDNNEEIVLDINSSVEDIEDNSIVLNNISVISNLYENDFVELTLSNQGAESIDEWTVIYEAEYTVLSTADAEIISNKDVIILKSVEKNKIIESGESVTLSLIISGVYSPLQTFRVYGLGKDDPNRYGIGDCIQYDIETQKSSLILYNPGDDYDERMKEIERKNNLQNEISHSMCRIDESLNPKYIIGDDGRVKVTAVNTNPYRSIALLIITWSDNTITDATGFMISSRYMLTAAHCLYKDDATVLNIKIYFGANGNTYSQPYYQATQFNYSSHYPSNHAVKYDWGCIKVSATPNRGHFLLGYKNDTQLENTQLTICGYPLDLVELDTTAPIHKRKWYMYRMSGFPTLLHTYTLRYTIDTVHGQSGSPIYSTGIAYGLHCVGRENDGYNAGRRVTASLIDYLETHGWYDD